MERAIVEGGRYLMADNSGTIDESKTERRFRNYQRLVSRIRDIDKNEPGQHPRWRLPSGHRFSQDHP